MLLLCLPMNNWEQWIIWYSRSKTQSGIPNSVTLLISWPPVKLIKTPCHTLTHDNCSIFYLLHHGFWIFICCVARLHFLPTQIEIANVFLNLSFIKGDARKHVNSNPHTLSIPFYKLEWFNFLIDFNYTCYFCNSSCLQQFVFLVNKTTHKRVKNIVKCNHKMS